MPGRIVINNADIVGSIGAFGDLLEVHIIELPKLPKEDDGSDLWKWMKFMSVREEDDLQMVATMSPVMEEAATCLRSVSEDEKTRQMLQSIRRREADDRVRLLEALEEEREKWQGVVAEKDDVIAEQAALIAKLKARFGENI